MVGFDFSHLPARLQAVAALVLPGSTVADVGTDHALLPLYLAGSGRCPLVIAIEAVPGPFRRALAAVNAAGLAGRVEVRQGDGLAPLQPGEVDTVVMAGLGALTQQQILSARPEVRQSLQRLVLQPQGDAGPLRRYLVAAGWRLEAEELVYERGHYYPILAAGQGKSPSYSDLEWQVGPLLVQCRHPLLREYLLYKMEKITGVLRRLEDGRSSRTRERHAELKRQLEGIRELLARV
ncbi:MAG: SAM-dependent methyltransferase [Moorella sp. (in: Bacteria)]|nr:SAM-dependent methyltransferase [Moorella sp. (in: firmicutes)]